VTVNSAELAAKYARERLELAQRHADAIAELDDDDDIDQVRVDTGISAEQGEAVARVHAFLRRHQARNIAEKEIIFRIDDARLLHSDLKMLLKVAYDAQQPKVIVDRPLRQCLHTADCDAGCRPYR
jgi:hypothetical protein